MLASRATQVVKGQRWLLPLQAVVAQPAVLRATSATVDMSKLATRMKFPWGLNTLRHLARSTLLQRARNTSRLHNHYPLAWNLSLLGERISPGSVALHKKRIVGKNNSSR